MTIFFLIRQTHIINYNIMLLRSKLHFSFSLAANFAILGLKTTVKFQAVKQKYYQLAKVYHPDVNTTDLNAQKKFTQITQAYKYIVDNYNKDKGYFQKRADVKDKNESTESKFKNQKRQKTRMEEDQYQDFHEYDIFFKTSKKFRKPRLGQDIYLNTAITLNESVAGVHKQICYTRYEPCFECSTKAFSACFSCGGKGEIYDRMNRQKVRCQACSGKGFRNDCLSCLGASYILKEMKETFYIDKGIQDKSILKYQYKGHSGYKADNGHLYITVLIQQSQKFKIDGNNVYSEYDLDYITATFGGNIEIQTVHGIREIKIEAGTQSGSQIRIFNAGLKSPFSKRMGDQIVKIKIKIPDRLSQKQKILMKKLDELEKVTK